MQLPDTPPTTRIDLPATDVHGQYLRISWTESNAVTLTNATLINQTTQQATTQKIDLHLTSADSGALAAYLPAVLQHHPSKLTLRTETNNINVPVNIGFRYKYQETYGVTVETAAQTVLFRLTQNGQTFTNSGINLSVPKNKNILPPPKTNNFPLTSKPASSCPSTASASSLAAAHLTHCAIKMTPIQLLALSPAYCRATKQATPTNSHWPVSLLNP
ncbi:hypothetical protein GCM10009007_10430 [Formosimonas limnophila]|uniref:Uncharacterized protein n=1 Tax=Formosimonas limnophila TaxID=1384487 RepID=A0A8J3CMN1_9BURK|nr:hypothetical protein GCM10009007_10430 [Formosimonas limnophila]